MTTNTNSIYIIKPYKESGIWMFDDESVGLVKEPFVSGADDIIEYMTASVDNGYDGFNLLFSSSPFPNSHKLVRVREEFGGNWYYFEDIDMEGWLCPALFKYFDEAPDELYVQFKSFS